MVRVYRSTLDDRVFFLQKPLLRSVYDFIVCHKVIALIYMHSKSQIGEQQKHDGGWHLLERAIYINYGNGGQGIRNGGFQYIKLVF